MSQTKRQKENLDRAMRELMGEEELPENPKVPAGLKRCSKCGHYKGKCMYDGEQWDISCVCKLSICKKCGKPVYKYPITSNIYIEENGHCWHIPICAAMMHRCGE